MEHVEQREDELGLQRPASIADPEDVASQRVFPLGRALVAGLCIAAAAAIAGLLTGSWDETNWKIIGDDSEAIQWLTVTAIAALGIDAMIGNLALLEVVDEVDEGGARAIGVLVVVAVLTTLLVPILRRLAPPSQEGELADIARRLAAMDLPPEAQEEVARLRRLTS